MIYKVVAITSDKKHTRHVCKREFKSIDDANSYIEYKSIKNNATYEIISA